MSSSQATSNLPLLLLLALCLFLISGIVAAHAPLSTGSNEGISGATVISNPEKSFVINTALNADGDPQYYRFPMQEGQVLYGSLMVPGPDSPLLDLVIIGPGINGPGTVPASIEVPYGSGAIMIRGKTPEKPSYEPFTPQPVYDIAWFNLTVMNDGDYYIAVTGPGSARYSLAPGFKEEFTAMEWLLVPLSVIGIHLWEGQSPVTIFAPAILVITCGFLAVMLCRKGEGVLKDPARLFILTCGLLYIGGAAMTVLQIIHAVLRTGYSPGVILTLLFITGPVVLGIFAIRAGLRQAVPESLRREGVAFALIGTLGLLFWAGLLLGPLLALAAAGISLLRPAGKT